MPEARPDEVPLPEAGWQGLLVEVSEGLLEGGLDATSALQLLIGRVSGFGIDICAAHTVDRGGRTLRLMAAQGRDAAGTSAVADAPSPDLADLSAIIELPAPQDSASTDALVARLQAFAHTLGARVQVCHPLLGPAGRVGGMLLFASTRRGRFSDSERASMRTLANVVALAWRRERAELAMQASDERYQMLFEAAPMPVAVVDPETLRLAAFNERVADMLGYGREELAQLTLDALDPDNDGVALMDKMAAVLEGRRKASFTRRRRRKDGSMRDVAVSAEAFELDGRTLVSETWVDITERLAATRALKASEERLRSIVNTAVDGIIVAGAEGRILNVNPAALRLFGYADEAELLGCDLGVLMPASEAERHGRYLVAHRGGGPARDIGIPGRELVGLRSDGSVFPIELSVASFEAGGTRFLTGIVRDVTERKRTEERQTLLMREVDHRAKNALAVVQAALKLTPKDDAKAYAEAVEGRVAALARAQTLLTQDRWQGADLEALLRGELAPFLVKRKDALVEDGQDGKAPRALLRGPPVMLPAIAAQPFSMAFHELATNAIKHGALSAPAGQLDIEWSLEGSASPAQLLRLTWREMDGPTVTPPLRRGFGSRVLDGTVRRQLGGNLTLDWAPGGLVCDMMMPLRPG